MAHKEQCPRCAKNGRDKSGDNLHVYGEDDGAFCYSCGYTILSKSEREARGLDDWQWEEEDEEITTKELLTKEEAEKIRGYTGTDGKGSRGIRAETYKTYGVRFEYSQEDGEVTKHYYPVTQDYAAAAYKIRILPKEFGSVGKFGKDSDLFGQWKFKTAQSKYVVITAGEIDCMSAYQMLEDYRKSRNSDYAPTPVVSSVIGETGSYKQVKAHYKWLNRFERIVVCYDNDKAGKEAVHELAKVLPKGKMYVMELQLKDTNKYLEDGRTKEWIDCFFKARAYSPDGIVGSGGLLDRIIEQALTPKIPLPPFMHRVQKQMAGGIPLGVIINLASASGTGKSTIIDECTYYWIFNSPHRIGVLSMESDGGQYGTKILSRHVGSKIDLIEDVDEKIAFLSKPEVVEQANHLFKLPDGQDRWHLIEDRDGGLESMKNLIMSLIITCECKVIICDPVSDLLESLNNEDQAGFCKWMKGIVKSHGVTFVNVCHVRKNPGGHKANSTGADLHEEDIFGSGSLIKSAACNLLFTRDKEAEDEIEKNTTYMKMSKCRWTGRTGMSGQYLYVAETHTMHDKEDWLCANSSMY
jgi:archaellum biogenesis ATPase FlaH